MYSTNNRSVITFTFYNCCCRCRCRCRWYCCMWLLIWLDSAVKTIHRMNLIYLLTTHSLSLILTRNIALFSSILFCSLCVRSCFLRAQNVKNSEMCKWNGRTNIKHRWKKIVLIILLIGMNGISYIHLCEWIQFKYTQSSKQAAELPHTFAAQFSLSNDAALKWIR